MTHILNSDLLNENVIWSAIKFACIKRIDKFQVYDIYHGMYDITHRSHIVLRDHSIEYKYFNSEREDSFSCKVATSIMA